jgi:hypothetical protein
VAGWITEDELRNRLPVGGDGVTTEEVEEAVASATEYVEALCGDGASTSALCRSAVAGYAQAALLDIIFPRDARDRDSQSVILRQNADASLARYRDIRESEESGGDFDDVPDGYVGVMNC